MFKSLKSEEQAMSYPNKGWVNKTGTSDRDAPGGSWKEYWISQSTEEWPETCRINGCYKEATDGAHMYCPSVDKREWIVPTCHSHNMQKGTYELKAGTHLVSANVSKAK